MNDELMGLPENWACVTLETVCKVISGHAFKSSDFSEQGVPVIKIANISHGEFIWKQQEYLPTDFLNHFLEFQILPETLLVALTRPITNNTVKACFYPKSASVGLLNQRVAAIKPYKEYSNDLLLFFSQSGFFRDQVKNHLSETLQPNLSPQDLKLFLLPLPPIAEQKRIVAKIEELRSKTQKAREALEVIPEMCDRFRQSVLAAAFRGDLTADWREENSDVEPALALLERIREKRQIYQLSYKERKVQAESSNPSFLELPENWTVAYPEDLCSPDNYSIGIGPFGSNLKVSDYANSGVPLIFVRHIRANNFKELDPKFISFDKAAELAPHIVKPLDLLITKMGDPPGDCEVYPEDQSEGVITSDCLKFRVWRDFLNNDYFKYCIDSIYVKKQLGLITRGVAQQKISVERFKSISLPLAPLDEQIEIVQRITKAFGAINLIQQQYEAVNAQLEKLDRAILAKAFRGELVAQDPNDEPALVLLERIREERAKVSARKSTKRKRQN